MTRAEQVKKLAQIAALKSQGEIEGWRYAIKLIGRGPFEGEMAALAKREKQIKEGR